MKYTFTLLFAAFTTAIFAQQVSDVVVTGAGYTNQIWYSLQAGEVASAPKDNWDLAFETTGFTSSIRINEQKGMAVFAAPFTTAEWADLDTASMSSDWQLLHNDPKYWERGAFNQSSTADVDLGWGIYNPVTHVVSGDSLYVVQLANGDFKKLRIDNLSFGVYNFTYANLDGTEEEAAQLVKADFAGKNFGYFNMETNEVVDREPATEAWDITFTKYIDMIGPEGDTPYGVTGVLQNYSANTSHSEAPVDEVGPYDFPYSSEINIIGYDWKTFDFTEGYIIAEDLSYFIQGGDGIIYQIIFTGFGGSATGEYEFIIEEVGTVGLTEAEKYNLNSYPNPSNGQDVNLSWESTAFSSLHILDLSGKLISSISLSGNAQSTRISTQTLEPGVYIVQLSGDNVVANQKLIVTN